MFYRFEIKNNGIEDVLYLYLTMSYEFSKDLGSNSNDKDLGRRAKNFIKSNNIDFKGEKVFLVIDDIVVKTLNIGDLNNDIEVLKSNLYYSNDFFYVNIKLDDGSFVETNLHDCLLSMLATNIDSSLEIETLKVISILYRSYIFKEMNENKYIEATNNLAPYKPISYYKLSWISNYQDIINKFTKAILETDCLFVTYNNHYITPFIHYCNYGRTLYNNNYPYLESVPSLWDLACPLYISVKDFNYNEISKLLHINFHNNSNINIVEVNENNLLDKIEISNHLFSGDEFVNKLGINSKNVSIILNNEFVRIICRGYGNFLGLSIFGANELAKNGCDYANILKYYYPKLTINKYIKELS